MAEASIPVDLLNPGQVFACLGFMEAADQLLGEAEAGFDWSEGAARFTLRAAGDHDPVRHVLAFLAAAEVVAIAPPGGAASDFRDKDTSTHKRERLPDGSPFPMPKPSTAEPLPILLRSVRDPLQRIMVAYWGDTPGLDSYKQWSGTGGKTGAGIAKGLIDAITGLDLDDASLDPFEISAPLSSGFRMDFRRDYIALDAGFSPNKHEGRFPIDMVGYPLVEILAAVGLHHARPTSADPINRMTYRYLVVGGPPLPAMFVRAALGATTTPVPGRSARRFALRLGYASQEGKAPRCITDVREETPDEPHA